MKRIRRPSTFLPEMPSRAAIFWVKKRVKLDTEEGIKEVTAVCAGGLCVHKDLIDKWWSVTSVTTGLCGAITSTESEAKKIVEILHSDLRCRAAFTQTSYNKLVGALPEWVRPWLLECVKRKVCVNPYGYMQRAMPDEEQD